jgi:ZIP family zinc transporter
VLRRRRLDRHGRFARPLRRRGNAVLSGASQETLSVLLAFAGGAVLASLADTLMPDAYREGGPYVAFATAAGLFVSFLLAEL